MATEQEIFFLITLRDLTSVVDQDASAVTSNDNKRPRIGGSKKDKQVDRDRTLQGEIDDAKTQKGVSAMASNDTTYLY